MYLQRAAIKRIAGYLGNKGLFPPEGIFGYLEWDEFHDIGIGESCDSAVSFHQSIHVNVRANKYTPLDKRFSISTLPLRRKNVDWRCKEPCDPTGHDDLDRRVLG